MNIKVFRVYEVLTDLKRFIGILGEIERFYWI